MGDEWNVDINKKKMYWGKMYTFYSLGMGLYIKNLNENKTLICHLLAAPASQGAYN